MDPFYHTATQNPMKVRSPLVHFVSFSYIAFICLNDHSAVATIVGYYWCRAWLGVGRSDTRDLTYLVSVPHFASFLGFPSFLTTLPPFPHTRTHSHTHIYTYTHTQICHPPILLGSLQYQQETALCAPPNNPNDLHQERSPIPIRPPITPTQVLPMTQTAKTIKRCARNGALHHWQHATKMSCGSTFQTSDCPIPVSVPSTQDHVLWVFKSAVARVMKWLSISRYAQDQDQRGGREIELRGNGWHRYYYAAKISMFSLGLM